MCDMCICYSACLLLLISAYINSDLSVIQNQNKLDCVFVFISFFSDWFLSFSLLPMLNI